jgi:hypothetical protein
VKKLLLALALAGALVAAPPAHALTEAQLLGTWELTSYLAVRETAEGSYHLVIDAGQRSAEYALVLRVRFQRDGACVLTRSVPEGGTQELAARYQKQTVDGQELIRLRLGGAEEVTFTLRAIVPDELTTLFFLSTTQGRGRFLAYFYDTFGSMERVGD